MERKLTKLTRMLGAGDGTDEITLCERMLGWDLGKQNLCNGVVKFQTHAKMLIRDMRAAMEYPRREAWKIE